MEYIFFKVDYLFTDCNKYPGTKVKNKTNQQQQRKPHETRQYLYETCIQILETIHI